MSDTPEENKAAQHIEEMHEFIAENQRLIDEFIAENQRCPDCKNSFLQPFVCTTCGAEKLYDATVETLRNQLAAAIKQRDKAREWIRGTLGTAHLKEMDKYIAEDK